jgi:hypothetical protein
MDGLVFEPQETKPTELHADTSPVSIAIRFNTFIETYGRHQILYVLQDTTTFSGGAVTASQVQNDFYQTVTYLYLDYHLGGYLDFAHSVGMKLRLQPYTITADGSVWANMLDSPEGESLGF